LTKRKEKFISLISVTSIIGIAIGVAALIIVIGVMTGFDRDLREKIVGNYSHITVTGYRMIDAAAYEEIVKKVSPNLHVRGISPYIQGQALVKDGKRFFAVGLRGIEPRTEPQVTRLKEYITAGSLDALDKDSVIIGRELAAYMGAGLGANVIIHSPTGKEYNLKVAGVFTSGMYDYDLNLVFTNLEGARQILEVPGQISAVAVKLDDLYLAPAVRDELAPLLGADYYLKTWIEQNSNFFAALKLEKFAMFIILFLIILVASFNIISTLVVTVVEKTKDIGIFKALGMPCSSVRKVFMCLGLSIGIIGVLFGTGIGILLCSLLKKYKFITLPPDVYYVTTLPVVIELWPDITMIVAGAIAIVLLSTFYPAYKAASLKPVEALRYE